MRLDLQNSKQSSQLEDRIKGPLYKKLYEASEKSNWMRITGLGIGVVSGVLTIARRVLLIAENILKALANILGAPLFGPCHFGKGVEQIFNAFGHTIGLPFSVFSAAVGLIAKPLCVLVSPTNYLYGKWADHDVGEWNNRAERIQRRKQQAAEEERLAIATAQQERARAATRQAERQRESELAQTRPLVLSSLDSQISQLQAVESGLRTRIQRVRDIQRARGTFEGESTDPLMQAQRRLLINTSGSVRHVLRASYDLVGSMRESITGLGNAMGLRVNPAEHRGHPEYDAKVNQIAELRETIEDLFQELEELETAA